jgi:hypothetical protein
MNDRFHLLSELDNAVMRLGQASAHLSAQEDRVALGKQRGDDTTRSPTCDAHPH